jgi:hypothetical protein
MLVLVYIRDEAVWIRRLGDSVADHFGDRLRCLFAAALRQRTTSFSSRR